MRVTRYKKRAIKPKVVKPKPKYILDDIIAETQQLINRMKRAEEQLNQKIKTKLEA